MRPNIKLMLNVSRMIRCSQCIVDIKNTTKKADAKLTKTRLKLCSPYLPGLSLSDYHMFRLLSNDLGYRKFENKY